MTKMKWIHFVRWFVMALAPGGALFASGCALRDFRDAVIGGSLGFIEGTTEELLAALVPIAEWLGG